MSRADIDAVPQFAEDIFRVVNRLPGLTSGDFTSRFSIRGGRPDETFIRIDGLEIYEPYHLKDFNDGAISIIDSETIEGVELMTGGFPVRYGNYTSGVFNINTRDPVDERTRYSAGLSLINARSTISWQSATSLTGEDPCIEYLMADPTQGMLVFRRYSRSNDCVDSVIRSLLAAN